MSDDAGGRNIVLGGLMGTGKTTLARRVAFRLGRQWVDTDELVTQRAGRSIAEIFASEGEQAFREAERLAVADAAAPARQVISLGGGVLLDPDNTRALRRGGVVVLLTGDLKVLADRASRSGVRRRPLLAGDGDPVQRLRELAEQRRAAYEAAADHVVDTTDGRSVEQLTRDIVVWAAAQPDVLTPEERRVVAA